MVTGTGELEETFMWVLENDCPSVLLRTGFLLQSTGSSRCKRFRTEVLLKSEHHSGIIIIHNQHKSLLPITGYNYFIIL